jgi:hypothetical protein
VTILAPISGSPKNISPSFAGGTVLMVKDTIDPSGSVPPSPAIETLLLGAISTLTLLATGRWLGWGSSADTVAVAGLVAPWLSVAL